MKAERHLHAVLGAAVGIAFLTMLTPPVLAQSSAGIAGIIAPGVAPELVQEGFVFTEGPVGTQDGGLYFSDIRANLTYFLDPAGKISVVRRDTNGANGLALTHAHGHPQGYPLRRPGAPFATPGKPTFQRSFAR